MNTFVETQNNGKIQQAYDVAIEKRLTRLSDRANSAFKSFADLVEEINRLQNESTGTTVKKEVATLANDMNNSTVMMTKMLAAQLETLHKIVRPEEATIL